MRKGCQFYAKAAFTLQNISLALIFLSETESNPDPNCGQKDQVNEKSQWPHRKMNPCPPGL